jgi:sugar O-acyltransferase (sialic acid O-acetyltransferase NeuD family)
MKKAIVWGATGQAIMLEEILRQRKISIVAFFENNKDICSPFSEIPIYYDKDKIAEYKGYYFIAAIGGSRGVDRTRISYDLKKQGLYPVTLIHQTAYVSGSSTLQEGIQVLPMAKICSRVKIDEYSIINTGSSIDHECVLERGVHIGPNAVVCGCVKIGEYSFVGANATILPRLKIGKNVIIGAGAVVTKNVPDNVVLVGNPARPLS